VGDMRLVGVDLGATHVRSVLADEAGNVVRRRDVPTLAQEGLEPVLDRIDSQEGVVSTARIYSPSHTNPLGTALGPPPGHSAG
jgi:predicted NBD/HSP70 family sugar kinase